MFLHLMISQFNAFLATKIYPKLVKKTGHSDQKSGQEILIFKNFRKKTGLLTRKVVSKKKTGQASSPYKSRLPGFF